MNAKPHPVIPYSEVTNEIGNLPSARRRVTVFTGFFNAKPHPVIPYSEVTNEIGNLLSARRRVTVFIGVFHAQSRGK
jgi:hypothetical protein